MYYFGTKLPLKCLVFAKEAKRENKVENQNVEICMHNQVEKKMLDLYHTEIDRSNFKSYHTEKIENIWSEFY